MQEEFDLIASEEQIAMMNKEYKEKGVGTCKCESHFFEYPIPVYLTAACTRFCECASAAVKILSTLDPVYISRNKRVVDFIANCLTKNKIEIARMANITQEIEVKIVKSPMKQSMYRLLELHNSMSVSLGDLLVCVKSMQLQEIIQRHMLAGSALHGLCI